jgi:hypothetical protein
LIAIGESDESGGELWRVQDLEIGIKESDIEGQLVGCVRASLDDAVLRSVG